MDKQKIFSALQLFLTPVLLVLTGVLLLLHPDFASAMIARVLGWLSIAAGAITVIGILMSKSKEIGRILFAVACFAIGGWLLGNPLKLAAAIGRIVGILLTIRGVQDIANAARWNCGKRYAVVTTVVGVGLILLPMTVSRLAMSACGIVLMVLGAAMLVDRMKYRGNNGTAQ